MTSLRVADLVRGIVAEGRPVTARSVARRVGACPFLVEGYLRALVKGGALVRRPSHPFDLYLPAPAPGA